MESSPQEYSARDDFSRGAAPPSECELPDYRPAQAANDVRMSQLARTIEQFADDAPAAATETSLLQLVAATDDLLVEELLDVGPAALC